MSKELGKLLRAIGVEAPVEVAGTEVTSLAEDSRQVQPGSLFVALSGQRHDGHQFIPKAIEAGAVAVVGEAAVEPAIPYFRVKDSRLALAQLAAAWHDKPADRLVMIGITGTDGKTTTANLLLQILREAGVPAGMITTVNAIIGDEVRDTGFHVTTPPARQVQAYLAEMVEAGMTHCLIEATSHGLAQRRVAACDFDVAVVTNITHEHLDYHGSQEAYRRAKAELFMDLDRSSRKPHGQAKVAVLNRDDSSYPFLTERTGARKVSYGLGPAADVRADDIESMVDGLRFRVNKQGEYQLPVQSRLIGRYNISNCLAALTTAVEGLGIEPAVAAEGLAQTKSVPGRMEPIDLGQDFEAIVDFAHTPNALRQALKAARERTNGRVIAIFGSAGLRDKEKRRMMAEISAELADITILTAEDPRTESLESILEEMAGAAESRGGIRKKSVLLEPDRGQAIRRGIFMADPGDLVIACGKGHEQSMCFGEIEYPWDDRQAMRAALAERLDEPGPAMPQLPTSPEATGV